MKSRLTIEMVLMKYHLMHTLGNEGMSRCMEILEDLYLLLRSLTVRCVRLRRVRQTIICAELLREGQLGLALVLLESMECYVHYVTK
jgi:hypothetical protein